MNRQSIVLAISILMHLKLFSLNLFQVYRRVVIIKELVYLYPKSPFSILSLSLYTHTHTHTHTFESWCIFISFYFLILYTKNPDILLYNHITVIKFRKFIIDTVF